ncbi:MAG TPA: hypothetical protein VLW55_12095 [Burkholderiaceae bacterium]|nr:hypothetical protein [Burkholderiaceae bacterium]
MRKFVLLAALFATTSVFANDVDPFGFEKEHFSGTMSRADVIDRWQQPLVLGNKFDDVGRVVSPPSTKTRAEVAAETSEAINLHLTSYGERGLEPATAEQEERIKVAGRRASHPGAASE